MAKKPRLRLGLKALAALTDWHQHRIPLFPRVGGLYGPQMLVDEHLIQTEWGVRLQQVFGRQQCVAARQWLLIPPVFVITQTGLYSEYLPPLTFNCRCVITEVKP